MPEVFVTWPQSALDVNNLPTTMTGSILSTTVTVTGLTNGTSYRTFLIQNPSDSFTPSSPVSLTKTYYRRVDATSVSTTTATWTGVNIADITQSKLCIAIVGRTSNVGTVNININGTGAQSMTGAAGSQSTRCAFIIVDKPAGTTMDVVSISSNGNWVGTSEAVLAVWGVSGGSIVSSGFDMKNLTTSNQTWSATLNMPAGGMVFAVSFARADVNVTTALGGADIDASWNAGAGGNDRFLGSRSGLSANASYVVNITMNRDVATQAEMAFGAIAVGP